MSRTGKAVYKRGRLHFDAVGSAMVVAVARRRKKSPTYIVNEACRRYVRRYYSEKA